MVREGIPVGALASATTQHLDEIYRQTGTVVWSPTYCEPAYDRLHSEWTMRRAQRRRLHEQIAERAARAEARSAEVADASVVDEVMAKYRRARPTAQSRKTHADVTTCEDMRQEIDAIIAARTVKRDR